MIDMLTVATVFAGFAFVIVVGAKLGAGSPESLAGMFAFESMPDRPHGVQEDDLPPFVFRDFPAPRTGTSPAAAPAGQVFEVSPA